MDNPLDHFIAPVRQWFQARFGEPTPPQRLGWPPIQRGEHTLILAPTGSGKTLAAFLWGINRIFEQLLENPRLVGVRLLYVSPLKALNNDIARNLVEPLRGIREMAQQMGIMLPELRRAVRTGDTLPSERQAMVRRPPHILITTPESLYLLLTSPAAQEMLRTVETVIVDEIHTLSGNKRGVHLALSLERLAALAEHPIQRIGLSATQRPLEEVARFLGGYEWRGERERSLEERPVTIVDAGVRKAMDLRVVTPVADLRRVPGGSIWPALIPQVLGEVRRHRTTLVFTNSRRAAERVADRLNEQFAQEESEEIAPGSPEGLLIQGVPKGNGFMGTGRVGGPFYAHHGSVSREVRLALEQDLKEGELPALVATSSLELGIDIGAVDAVIQIQSPRGIARGLQRIGRAGHLVGQTSYGRIYVTHREDLLDAAAVAHGILEGDIEPTYTPQNCLDVLAQQIVAMVAVAPREVHATYDLVRQAAGYRYLPWEAYLAVLKMVSGGYAHEDYRPLRPCIVWDQVNGWLYPLPGTRLLALRNGGTIPDRGEFHVYLPDGRTNLGTLDEEFVFETRVGDVFTLGSNTWRVVDINEDRLIVAEAAGAMPRMPFWHGEAPKRDYHMGLRLGAFRRALAERVAALPWVPEDPFAEWPPEAEGLFRWLRECYAMDEASVRNAALYVRQQIDAIGAISSDQTIVVERFADALGDQRLVIHTCFGARVNSAWALALVHALRERLGITVEVQVNDDAILFRLVEGEREPPLDIITGMSPEEARERVLQELPHSALFGAQFRMNAARALILPRVRGGGRRTPFWLQRLRAKDLLALAKGWEDFPLVAETYRDCLRDVLDLQHMSEILSNIVEGKIRVLDVETIVPSPVAAGILFEFAAVHLYEDDTPKLERQIQALSLHRELLAQLLEEDALADLLRPEAIVWVESQLQHLAEGYQARTVEELIVMLQELGDLSTEEIQARCQGEGSAWLLHLAAQGRVLRVEIPTSEGSALRWIITEDYARYQKAFGLPALPFLPAREDAEPPLEAKEARLALLRRLLRSRGPMGLAEIRARYAFPKGELEEALERLIAEGRVVRGRFRPGASEPEWCDRQILERLHRETLTLLRREIQPVDLPAFADFLVRWQGIHPENHVISDDFENVVGALVGVSLPAETWERDVFPLRVKGYNPSLLDEAIRRGDLVWVAQGGDPFHLEVRFFWRGEGAAWGLVPDLTLLERLGELPQRVYAFLEAEGSAYAEDIEQALGLERSACEEALVSLMLAGLITNETWQPIRALLARSWGVDKLGTLSSSLEETLAKWRAQRRPETLRPPSRAELSMAKRRAATRAVRPRREGGRWSPVRRYGVLGAPCTPSERAQYQARPLLLRYGILARDLLDREPTAEPWASLYPSLQRMELRGEIRRGYFVRGLAGQQFALPEAVESLRRWRRTEVPEESLVLVNAVDPALVYSRALVSEEPSSTSGTENLWRFDRIPSNYVILRAGSPILVYEHGGGRWRAREGEDVAVLQEAVRLCLRHITRPGGIAGRPRRVYVRTWNGLSPLEPGIQEILAPIGFRREALSLVWDGLQAGL